MVQAYFDNLQQEIIKQIQAAQKSIFLAIAYPSDGPVFEILCEKARDIPVELIIDYKDKTPKQHCINLKKCGGKVYYIDIAGCGIMHHKFCIIDESILITGSYNWSHYGQGSFENIVVIKDDFDLCKNFKIEFDKISDKYRTLDERNNSPEWKANKDEMVELKKKRKEVLADIAAKERQQE